MSLGVGGQGLQLWAVSFGGFSGLVRVLFLLHVDLTTHKRLGSVRRM